MGNKDNNFSYIISVQASSIMRAMMSEKGQVVSKDYMYKATLPYSLDMIKLREIAPKTFVKDKYGVETNKAIINVDFNSALYSYIDEEEYQGEESKRYGYQVKKKDSKRGKKLKSTKQLREELYRNGFKLDGKEYVELKRSSSKAKEGSHLFIMKKYHKEMQNFCRLNIKVPKRKDKKVELTALKAYEALTSSTIEYTIDIKPEEILIVRDIKNTFNTSANVIRMGKDKIPYNEFVENYEMENDCVDGMSLMDSSLFSKDENGCMKSFQLLRNVFLKSASFNCEIQKFFKERNITTVYNAYGKPHDASKIKLIITPNSLKIYKLSDYIKSYDKPEDAYNYWISNISSTFGVVKSEHISTFGYGNYNKLSYQMINSLPFTYDDICDLLKTDFRYIENLKKYPSVFRKHINNTKIVCTGDMIENMIAVSDEFQKVDLFKRYRSVSINHYKNKMKTGKISVAGDYGTLCSMPYEFLLSTLYQETDEMFDGFLNNVEPLQKKGEIYKADLMENQQITLFRSPHICASNVIVAINKKHNEFDKWFNFNKGIIVLTPWEWDIMERGNSLDFDSDSALCVKSNTILKRALEVQKFATPVNEIPSKSKKPYYNTPESLADLDDTLAINKIGEIVNLSQVLNSYFWDEYYKGENADKKMLDDIYEQILVLAILSNIEIDKSKHVFDLDVDDTLNSIRRLKIHDEDLLETEELEIRKKFNQDELQKIYELKEVIGYLKCFKEQEYNDKKYIIGEYSKDEYNNIYQNTITEYKNELNEILKQKEIVTKAKKPYFLKYNQEGVYVWDEEIDCPMNFLVKEIKRNSNSITDWVKENNLDKATIPFSEFLRNKEIDFDKGNRDTRKFIYDTVEIMLEKRKELRRDKLRDKKKDSSFLRLYEDAAIVDIMKRKLSLETIMGTIYHIYNSNGTDYKKIHSMRLSILGILWKSQQGKHLEDNLFLECLKSICDTRTELVEDDKGYICVWGTKYSEKSLKIVK